jgi:cell division protein FtsI/penicillin-binding protein 2
MAEESPMTDRIRGSMLDQSRRPRFRIPRKGRIRFFLCCIVAAAGYRLAGALLDGEGGGTVQKRADTVQAAGGKGASEEPRARRVSLGARPDFAKVAGILAQCPPKLTSSSDTIQAGDGEAVVHYSIDTSLQRFFLDLLKQYRPRYGAGAVMDPKTGRVLALVSYRNDSAPDLGARLFARSIFPAASIFKTVTAAAAIETAGYSSETMVPVAGRNHTLYRFQLKREVEPWTEITFGDAYAQSVNAVFGRIGMHAAGRKVIEEASGRFGFNDGIPFELAVDTSRVTVPDDTSYAMAELASGFNPATTLSPLHGACIAAAVQEDGAMPCPRLVDSICRGGGRCVYRSRALLWRRAFSPAVARELRALMAQVPKAGTARKAFGILRRCAWSAELDYGGKTGSLQVDSMGRIDWFVGFAAARDGAPERRLALGIVTVHGEQWTVHSSFLAAEIFRKRLRPALKKGGAAPALPVPADPSQAKGG